MNIVNLPKGFYGVPSEYCFNEANKIYKCSEEEKKINEEYEDITRKCLADEKKCRTNDNIKLENIIYYLQPFKYVIGSSHIGIDNIPQVDDPGAFKKYFETSKVGKVKKHKKKNKKLDLANEEKELDVKEKEIEYVVKKLSSEAPGFKEAMGYGKAMRPNYPSDVVSGIKGEEYREPILSEITSKYWGESGRVQGEGYQKIIKNLVEKIKKGGGKFTKKELEQGSVSRIVPDPSIKKPKKDKPKDNEKKDKPVDKPPKDSKKKESKKRKRTTISVYVGAPRKSAVSKSVKAPRKTSRVATLSAKYFVPQTGCRAKHISCKGHIIGKRQLNLRKVLNMSTERVNKYLRCNSLRL